MPEVAQKFLQLAPEVTWGTMVTPTTARFQGLTDLTLTVDEGVQGSEQLGLMGAPTMMTEVYQEAKGSLGFEASYEDLMYMLHSLFGAGTKTGTTAPYTWTYNAPLQDVVTPYKQSAQMGMPGGYAYNVPGFILANLTLKGEAKGMWTGSADFIAKSAVKATQTSLADRTVNGVRLADTTFYVDTWAGTIGSTAAAATLRAFELSIDGKRHTKFFAGGLTPLSHGMQRWDVQLKLTVELNATSQAWTDAMLTPGLVQKQIQIKATTGAGATLKEATINFAGVLAGAVDLAGPDEDGNAIMELTWLAQYNSTLTNYLQVILKNAVSAIV